VLAEQVIDHLRAGLGALAEHDGGLRADLAGLGLAITETAHVGHGCACRDDGFGCADIGLRAGLLCAAARQQHQHDREPECHSHQEEHD
jgi:hypothetical protein